MNKSSSDRARLLAGLQHGDWSTGPAAAFARAAAAHARRRRFVERASAVVCGIAAAGAAIAFFSPDSASDQIAENITPVRTSTAKGYEIISDVELLALVSDRPLLVVQTGGISGGARQVVTFGQ